MDADVESECPSVIGDKVFEISSQDDSGSGDDNSEESPLAEHSDVSDSDLSSVVSSDNEV